MKKLLLTGLTLSLFLTACQKDYYLDDLREAEATIEQLQSQVNALTAELNVANITIATQNQQLLNAQRALEDLQAEYTYVNESQSAFIHELNAKIEGYLTKIAELEGELAKLEAYTQQVLENYTYDVVSLKAQIAALQAEIAAYEPEIIEVIKEVEVIVKEYITEYEIEYIELNPNITALGLPDTLANGAATFLDRSDIDVAIGDRILAVDYITGVEQYVDVEAVVETSSLITIIFTENINVTSQIILFKVIY